MAGYSHQAGMSNNAVAAYSVGIKPITRITRRDLDAHELDIPLAFARWLAKHGHWPPSEWHHSGGTWYNRVNFYDPADLAELVAQGDIDVEALRLAWKAPSVKVQGQRVKGTYASFGGSRRRPRFLGDVPFTGTLIGDWIHIDAGGRKRATGNHITYTKA